MAERAGQIEYAEPGRREVVVGIALELDKPVTMVAVKAIGLEKVGSIFKGTKLSVTLQQLHILPGFLPLIDANFTILPKNEANITPQNQLRIAEQL